MLKEDPKQRASLEDVKKSEWFNKRVHSDAELTNIMSKCYQ